MKLNLINGNGNKYQTKKHLTIAIINKNDTDDKFWINHLKKQTGLTFKRDGLITNFLIAKPKNSVQVVRLLTMASTYCLKVCYTNNWNASNTLYFMYTDRKENLHDNYK